MAQPDGTLAGTPYHMITLPQGRSVPLLAVLVMVTLPLALLTLIPVPAVMERTPVLVTV